MRTSRGFTMMELIIAVAIVAILAAIAIPNYLAMQLKAKRAELPTNVESIKLAEVGFETAHEYYLNATAHPRETPDKNAVAWTTDNEGFEGIGWRADSDVRGVYEVVDASNTEFTVQGVADCDGDGLIVMYTANQTTAATLRDGDSRNY